MNFSLENDKMVHIDGNLRLTYVVEYPVQFIVHPVRKAHEQAPSSAEHHVA